ARRGPRPRRLSERMGARERASARRVGARPPLHEPRLHQRRPPRARDPSGEHAPRRRRRAARNGPLPKDALPARAPVLPREHLRPAEGRRAAVADRPPRNQPPRQSEKAIRMNKEQTMALRRPFPPESVGRLPKGGVMLDYVGHAAVTDRLLTVDPEWS